MTRSVFLRRARRLGLSRAEAADLYSVRGLPGGCEAVQGRIQAKRRDLRRRMSGLEAVDMALTILLVECWRQQGRGDCRVRRELVPGPAAPATRPRPSRR